MSYKANSRTFRHKYYNIVSVQDISNKCFKYYKIVYTETCEKYNFNRIKI